eukprot:NODE_5922_length_272_cov_10.847534_g5839_i0.p1 GENE.NODE_5922_length_272_cov_10.847534_g5839_i0~~NODE_5922_length_272_cov_10.847534_g5839_i0.p1  ORF type:complete len:60 (-),score=10.62 NODE_5922_length_272_cov_10.847534_g5839_i0:35-214(-)
MCGRAGGLAQKKKASFDAQWKCLFPKTQPKKDSNNTQRASCVSIYIIYMNGGGQKNYGG